MKKMSKAKQKELMKESRDKFFTTRFMSEEKKEELTKKAWNYYVELVIREGVKECIRCKIIKDIKIDDQEAINKKATASIEHAVKIGAYKWTDGVLVQTELPGILSGLKEAIK